MLIYASFPPLYRVHYFACSKGRAALFTPASARRFRRPAPFHTAHFITLLPAAFVATLLGILDFLGHGGLYDEAAPIRHSLDDECLMMLPPLHSRFMQLTASHFCDL